METFELKSHLRLLQSSVHHQQDELPFQHGSTNSWLFQLNPAAKTTNFVDSGQRLDTLKSLRRLLNRSQFFHSINQASTLLVIFDVLKSILIESTDFYFKKSDSIEKPFFKKSNENVFIMAVRRNEILQLLQLVIDLVGKFSQLIDSASQNNNLIDEKIIEPAQLEHCYGKMFLPQAITLLGHESSDVQRHCIRFLQLYINRTSNLHRIMESFIDHGLKSNNLSTQFGSLNALPYLFIRQEFRAENMQPLIDALGFMLVESKNKHSNLFYLTYVSLERIDSLIGTIRFIPNLAASQSGDQAIQIYELIQKRAPSSYSYIDPENFISEHQTRVWKGGQGNETIFLETDNNENTLNMIDSVLQAHTSHTTNSIRDDATHNDESFLDHSLKETKISRRNTSPPLHHPQCWSARKRDLTKTSCGSSEEVVEQKCCSHQWQPLPKNNENNDSTVSQLPEKQEANQPALLTKMKWSHQIQETAIERKLVESSSWASSGPLSTSPPSLLESNQVKRPFSNSDVSIQTTINIEDDQQQQHLSMIEKKLETSPATDELSNSSDLPKSNNKSKNRKKKLSNSKKKKSFHHKDDSMAATAANYYPGLASLVNLDADSLASLDYFPKNYYAPYLHAATASYPFQELYGPISPVAAPHYLAHAHLLRFGLFPRVLIYQALSSIADEQFAAVQAIVRIVRDAPLEHLLLLIPHTDEFLTVFVSQLLLDGASNFKVILWTLDIIELLTERLKLRMHPFLSQFVLLLSRRLGDNRIVIRDSVIKVFHQMMFHFSPQEMLDLLFKHGTLNDHQKQPLPFTSSSKTREEMVNRVTATVSTFPRAQLNLSKLCFDVAPLLIDRRSSVRLAAIESIATLAQALGPHRLGSLMTAVHSLDSSVSNIDLDRLIAAIQARLARRSLPKVGADGSVQYVLRVPKNQDSWYYRRIYDADLEWIAFGPSMSNASNNIIINNALNTPISNNDTYLRKSTRASFVNQINNSSENSSEKSSAMDLVKSGEEERLARHEIIQSADSEDIPPPIKSQMTPNRRSLSPNNNNGYSQMPQVSTGPTRKHEKRSHSLERSKTSQEYRPSKPEWYIDRLIHGESVDDSDLTDSYWLRKSSSIESLEAWRQYFGRFKKQMADIGWSRPASGIYYGLSPPPPAPLVTPAYYYYYYMMNGLSHSYHDLSQLQQQNMLNIMRRSGFYNGEESQLKDSDIEAMLDVEESAPSKNQSDDGAAMESSSGAEAFQDGKKASKKSSRSVTEKKISKQDSKVMTEQSFNDNEQQHRVRFETENNLDVDFSMERSLSMPSIRTDEAGKEENNAALNDSSLNQQHQTISDEIIQELEMWEKVIQEEKNTSSSVVEKEVTTFSNEKSPDNHAQQQQQASAPIDNQMTSIAEIPTVNVQQASPTISNQEQPGSIEEISSAQVLVEDDLKENHEQNEQNSGIYAQIDDQQPDQQTEQLSTTVPEETIPVVDAKKDPSPPPKLPPPPAAPVKGAPTARRLSRPAQQLYIKTTPAIPMNANIQHILGNVARTEGAFDFPNEAVREALVALNDHAWTTKVEGMLAVVRLAIFHPLHLLRYQHQISLALVAETRNLRSTVARSAIFTIGEIFSNLKSQIEPEMDILTQALLHKVSENSVFIREDIDRALSLMVASMPQTRSALCLITFGSNHRNAHVRRTCAEFLSILVEKMGAMKCLLGPREIGEHLLPAAARFIQDGSSHTRYFGRRIFVVLMQHPMFDKLLRRHVSPGTYRNISGMLETIKRRGVGDQPPDLHSPTVHPNERDPRRLVVVEAPAETNADQ